MNKPRILIVEDDAEWQEIYRRCLSNAPYEITSARKVSTALTLLQESTFDVVITDLKMLGGTEEFSGFGVLDVAKQKNPDAQVIVITGYGSVEHAIRAMGSGAYDYITKDRDLRNKLPLTVQGALEVNSLKRDLLAETQTDDVEPDANRIIGNSASMQALFEQIAQVSDREINVLIHGEGGTGKRLIAQTIHLRSRRKNGPFLVVDCGRLSESVLEAELFGFEPGTIYSFNETGRGKFEQARGGTIFLDGLGDLDVRLQPRLIGAICDRRVERSGGKAPISVDARIIASTDKDLKALSKRGQFDRKLFDALGEFVISVPPLRQRKDGDDIPALAALFLQRHSQDGQTVFSTEAIELLKKYDYPGNIRELESIVKHALSISNGRTILPEHLRPELRETYTIEQKSKDEKKEPASILRICPLNRGDCTKKEEIVRLYASRRVFVNIPYSNDFADHENVIRETLEEYGLVPVVSKDYLEPGMLLCNVCKLIQTCKYGVTDISLAGTNVFYELGLMHAVGIHCAILKDRRTSMSSDIGGLLFLEYTSPQSLKEKLKLWISGQVKEASQIAASRVRQNDDSPSRQGIYIGGPVQGNVIIGDHSRIQTGLSGEEVEALFHDIYQHLAEQPTVARETIKTTLDEIKQETKKGDSANQSFLKQRLLNLAKMAPDIFQVITASLTNPAAGVSLVVQKIAEKAREEAGK